MNRYIFILQFFFHKKNYLYPQPRRGDLSLMKTFMLLELHFYSENGMYIPIQNEYEWLTIHSGFEP